MEKHLQTELIYMMLAFNDLCKLQNAWGDLKEIEVGKYCMLTMLGNGNTGSFTLI